MSQTAQPPAATYVLALEEIAKLSEEGGKLAETLMHVVAEIAERFQTNVCSAYLLEPDGANLMLAATVGLRPQCIGTLRLARSEGLAGLVAEQVLAVEQAQNHPRFKYFREAGEDPCQSFLGVLPHGPAALCKAYSLFKTLEPRVFQEYAIRMLGEAAAQLSPVVSEARTLVRFIAPAQEKLWPLARNVWWIWDNESANLFRDLDPDRRAHRLRDRRCYEHPHRRLQSAARVHGTKEIIGRTAHCERNNSSARASNQVGLTEVDPRT